MPAGDYLNIRNGAGTSNTIVARAPNGTILRNLGCRGSSDMRWCHVQTTDGQHDGWVSGAYLRESGGPVSTTPARPGITIPSGSATAPTLHVRPTGEIEAAWTSGCVVLFNSARQRINAGSTCSDAQLIASDLWVAQM
ncbi:SH3 domain-containing protein [Pseudooceanicola atlanticus]|uniref:SH3 domain-containing protein n=1 Tax=Pseudooceanicola atlanticus TaxID=1461694 RepID=UPI00138E0FB2|nr:SH3 domain-containing protein [Pseudooceanicola atlanticus]